MLELLVAGLCVGDYACDKAVHAYYQGKPVLQRKVKEHRKQAERYLPEALLYSAPAVIAVATKNKKSIRLYGPLYLSVGNGETVVLFKRSF